MQYREGGGGIITPMDYQHLIRTLKIDALKRLREFLKTAQVAQLETTRQADITHPKRKHPTASEHLMEHLCFMIDDSIGDVDHSLSTLERYHTEANEHYKEEKEIWREEEQGEKEKIRAARIEAFTAELDKGERKNNE